MTDERDRYRPKTPPAGVRAQSMHGVPVEQPEEITGRYEGELLEQKRAERDARARERIAALEVKAGTAAHEIRTLRQDLRTIDKLVDANNTKLEYNVMPLVERLPKELEAIRLDAKVGGWIRRHANKAVVAILVAIGSALAGLVGGYLSNKLGISP